MTVCTSCGTPAPDEMRHCSQCGNRLPEPEPEAPGNTSHFGDQDIKNLMSRVDSEQLDAADEGNLLAGLPRPKVGSMLSPLRGGQTASSARKPEKRARSASGSTVMGMPIFATGEQRQLPRPRPSASPAVSNAPAPPGAALDDGPSIQSLGSFQDDLAAPPPPGPGAAESLDAAPEPTPPAADGAPPAPREPSIDDTPQAPAPAAPENDAPSLPSVEELDITSPDRATEMSPAVGSSGGGSNIAIAVILIAAIVAGVAFFLLK